LRFAMRGTSKHRLLTIPLAVPQSLFSVLTQNPVASSFAKTKLAGIFKNFGCPAL
jgi:hypothetical protein